MTHNPTPSSFTPDTPDSVPATATPDAGKKEGTRVRLRVDDRNVETSYVNAFRSNLTVEEVVLDMGIDLMTQAPNPNDPSKPAEVLFQVKDRLIMNYHTAKRLAITLGQVIREYEQHHGEITTKHASKK